VQRAPGRSGKAIVLPGANVSDREHGWKENFRCPEVVVAMHGGPARDCGTHWCGGPDFLAEIVSQDDKSRDKFDFYAKVGVCELLIVDRDPWVLKLYRLQGSEVKLVGTATLANASPLESEVLGVSFKLVQGQTRPQIEVTHKPSQSSSLA
jgi:Uma2 family endonuclease